MRFTGDEYRLGVIFFCYKLFSHDKVCAFAYF